ncbi:leucine-rich repeat neuronal protein 4 isoform X1 [Canis lupus familiaris]|uniref:leucine-rich repeat neuronal protein 4 isoform X1 n=1 Tax=Canis lupus familiaris TaxID=9615 RepID=UPI0018F3BFC4|nr:leucine-rich repeat neuronal protein 4 isoform X1 [Canis lupus familiaris]
MWWAPLPLPLLLLPTALRPGWAGPPQERGPPFRPTPQDPRASGAGNATASASACEGLPAAGASTLSLANRSLERLPGCLPPALRSLDGSRNLLRALSAAELGHLPRLRALTLSHNRIAALRWGPGGPAALHTLDLSYNRLAALPPCAGPALPGLRSLGLAGNPLRALQPRAFACLPALRLLNLSSTALGRDPGAGIADGAFAGAGGALEVLDLSGTFLERVQSGWIKDLQNLTSLYLRKMPRLRILEGDIFKMNPNLRQLDCQDSSALSSVHTHIFQDTPCLQVLLLQNCNLSSFPPWNLHSSQVLSISLFGNPLICSCELSWLLRDAKRTILSRAADTACAPASGSHGVSAAPLPLSRLPAACPRARSAAVPEATRPPGPFAHAPPAPRAAAPRSTARPARPAGAGRGVPEAPGLPPASRGPQAPPRAPQPGPSEGAIPVLLLGDSSEEEAGAGAGAGQHGPAAAPPRDAPCDYHPCRHLQTPCAELQRRWRCRCPGLSGEDTAPDPPRLQAVTEVGDTSALVRWCAPNSAVRGYQIRYSAEGGAGNRSQSVVAGICATARQHALHGLSPATAYRVCVLAANAAGLSLPRASGLGRPRACAAFTTKPSSALVLAGLCAACGLLLVASLLLALCLCRRRRAPRPPRRAAHLVAYRNPAFQPPPEPRSRS